MNTPILISVDEIIHTFEQPYRGDATCPCNALLRDANAEAVAQLMTIERGMSLPEARQTLRMAAQRLGDNGTVTYDSETHSFPHRENERARWHAESCVCAGQPRL